MPIIVIPIPQSKPHFHKKNVVKTWGTCQRCRRTLWLRNYDTKVSGEYKHIRHYCYNCQTFEECSATQWQACRDREIPKTISAYEADPRNQTNARDLLNKIQLYHDRQAMDRVGGTIRECLPDDGDIVTLLADTYSYLGMPEKAIGVTKAAVARGHSLLRKLLVLRLQNGQVEETRDFVMLALEYREPDAEELAYTLVEGYQVQGRHAEAKDMLRLLKQVLPKSAKSGSYKQLASLSWQFGITKTPCSGKRLTCPVPEKLPMPLFLKLLIFGTPLAALILYTLFAAFVPANVYLVGSQGGYGILINGKVVTVPAYAESPQKVNVGWNEFTIEPGPGSPRFDDIRAKHDSSFWDRPFYSKVYVVTPDAAAPILKAGITYDAAGNIPPDLVLHTGQVLYKFDDVDYAFTAPPDTIQLDSGQGRVTRTCLRLLTPEELQDIQGH